MLEKLKGYWQAFLAVALAVVSVAFLFERSRRKTADAIADNKEDLDKVNELEKKIAANDGKLEAEETKREETRKETDAAKKDDSGDTSEFLKNR